MPAVLHMDAEQEAYALAESEQGLLRRLLNARAGLGAMRKHFAECEYDYEGQRLVSSCGRFTLQWRVRLRPDKPASPKNPQSPRGVVILSRT